MFVKCIFCGRALPPAPGAECPHPECGQYLPADYVETCRTHPPVEVVVAGYSQHGKTEFLLSLFATLDALDRRVEGAFCTCLDQGTEDTLRMFRERERAGRPVDSTKKGETARLLLGVRSLPPFGDRFCRLFDTAGEVFKTRADVSVEVPALADVGAVWLVHSPFDQFTRRPDESLTRLLEAVQAGFQAVGAAPTADRPRPLVVVFSKTDKLVDENQVRIALPREVSEYTAADPFAGCTGPEAVYGPPWVDVAEYVAGARKTSAALERYTAQVLPGGSAFVSMARRLNYRPVLFTATSALGQDAVPGADGPRLAAARNPYRVTDPFLLTLALPAVPPKRRPRVHLVLDLAGAALPNADAAAQALGAAAGAAADLVVYELGRARPLSAWPAERGARPRLVGPILDRLPADARALVLAAGPVPDLAEFRAAWGDRLALVRLDGGPADRWPEPVRYRPDTDAPALIRKLLSAK